MQPIPRLDRVPSIPPSAESTRANGAAIRIQTSPRSHKDEHGAQQRDGPTLHSCNCQKNVARGSCTPAPKTVQAKRQCYIQSPSVRPEYLGAQYGEQEANRNRQREGNGCRPYCASRNPSIQHARLRPWHRFALCPSECDPIAQSKRKNNRLTTGQKSTTTRAVSRHQQ